MLSKILLPTLLLLALKDCLPSPPAPTPNPTSTPIVIVTPTPTPTVSPTSTPTVDTCIASPVPTDPGKRYINTRVVATDSQSHQPAKLDSTPRVRDEAYCQRATGASGIFDCKANPEGSGYDSCDKEFLGGIPCPYWQWSLDKSNWKRCTPVAGIMSCDHFDNWVEGTPYTGKCEKDNTGGPVSGFYMVLHGKGYVRACNKDFTICSDPVYGDH